MLTPQTHPIIGKLFDGLATSLHANAWADAEERRAEEEKDYTPPYLPGGQILDYCGEPSEQARFAAAYILGQLAMMNNGGLLAIIANARLADGLPELSPYPHTEDENTYVNDLGFDLGHMVLGNGASWFDNHEEFELKKPYVEFYYD